MRRINTPVFPFWEHCIFDDADGETGRYLCLEEAGVLLRNTLDNVLMTSWSHCFYHHT